MTAPQLAVVVPVMNEAGNILPQIEEIAAALQGVVDYEIVYVDDGSNDATPKELQEAQAQFPELRVIRHTERSGQSAAIRTGVAAAHAPWIATLDGDRQNDPADIPKLWDVVKGTEAGKRIGVVAGHRANRHDSAVRLLSSRIANGVRSRVLRDGTPDTGCGLKVFSRDAFLRLPFFAGLHRFIPALMRAQGLDVEIVQVRHRARTVGKAKYGINNRLWIGIVDLLGVFWLVRRARAPQATEQ